MKPNQSTQSPILSGAATAPLSRSQSSPAAAASAPTVTTPVVPPPTESQTPKPAAPPKLGEILAGARDALGHALRVMIANQLPEGDGGRRLTENAFEAAKNLCQTPGRVTRKDVAAALDGLTVAVGYLANHSRRLPEDLNTARAAQHKLTKLAEQYDTLAA